MTDAKSASMRCVANTCQSVVGVCLSRDALTEKDSTVRHGMPKECYV